MKRGCKGGCEQRCICVVLVHEAWCRLCGEQGPSCIAVRAIMLWPVAIRNVSLLIYKAKKLTICSELLLCVNKLACPTTNVVSGVRG